MESYQKHYSVLNKEVITAFKDTDVDGKIFIDLTFGAGGHSFAILEQIENSKVIAFDQDREAYENGLKLIQEKGLEDRIQIINSNFVNLKENIDRLGYLGKVSGVIMDLGVSSHHFDSAERGFSFRKEASLDMRMNQFDDSVITAKEIINTYPESELADIFFKYGEERLSRRIAAKIIEKRSEAQIETTKELEEICFVSYPKRERHKKTHPATRVFQALRIFVNDELGVLERVLPDAMECLAPGGILAGISFHSMEDRILKHSFRKFDREEKIGKIITKRPIVPSEEELSENNRSRSAKLRLIKKL